MPFPPSLVQSCSADVAIYQLVTAQGVSGFTFRYAITWERCNDG
jgi:hypothetical protein